MQQEATASQGETAIVSVATDLLSRSLEPLESGLNSDAPAGGPSATASAAASAGVYARPLPLVEALERSGDRSRRLWISQAYWKVSAGFAMLRWSTEALERLESIGALHETPPEDRYGKLVDRYVDSLAAEKSALIVSPTWQEIETVTEEVRRGLRAAGRAIVLITHDMDFALRLADRAVILGGGPKPKMRVGVG